MDANSKTCTCETCPGPNCTCGCHEVKTAPAAGCQCGSACACGPACGCGATCGCKRS